MTRTYSPDIILCELAYEIYTPSRSGISVTVFVERSEDQEIDVYGLEALDLLRIEKASRRE